MSILSALKQEGSSIDELAKLPQAMIMQMAQKKQLGAEMVAPILARKAEMADAVARTRALKQAGAPMPTVMEQLMQKNAEAEQPEPVAREMGVAQLPIDEGMYDEQRMASGGIVAFQKGGDVDLPPREPGESENAYMQRVQALYGAGSQFFTPRNYNPLAKLSDLNDMYQRNIGQPFAEGVSRFTNESPEAQAAKFRSYAQQPKTEAGIAALAPKSMDSQYEEQGRNAYVSAPVKQTTAAKTAETKAGTKAQSALQKATGAPEMAETKVDPIDALISKYENMLAGSSEEAAKAKKQAMWSRLTEAGLGIMGGTSTNFAENVGKGATQAMKGYAEDVKGLRSEETARLNQLASLGLKGAALKQEAKKIGITEKRYDQWYKAQMAQIGETAATRRDATSARADTALDNRVATLAAKMMTQPKYMDDPELAYADAQKMVTGKSAQPSFTGFSGRSLK
jgi:hypothetical protein